MSCRGPSRCQAPRRVEKTVQTDRLPPRGHEPPIPTRLINEAAGKPVCVSQPPTHGGSADVKMRIHPATNTSRRAKRRAAELRFSFTPDEPQDPFVFHFRF